VKGRAVAVRELLYAVPVLRAPRRPRSAIEERAVRGIQEMLRYARERVPYYADPAYDRDIATLADLATLPMLRKEIVHRVGPEPLCPTGWRGWFQVDASSGTTGLVIRVRHDAGAYGYHGATILRRFLASGYRPWWTIAQIKPFERPHRWFQRFGAFRRTVVRAGQPDEVVKEQILALRPNVIMGYPVMLRALVRNLTDEEMARLRRTLRLVMTDSELVTEPVRALLAGSFGVPVCDEYSAYEVLTVGSHCRHGTMHVDEDRVVLEIVDDDGVPVPDGTEGAVVVTHYRERAMPLVRYWLGDRAIALPPGCACGSNFRRMVLTRGRSEDYVQLPGGRRVYIGTFLALTLTVPGIAEVMIRQAATGTITVHLIVDPRSGFTFDEVAASIRDWFTAHLGIEVDLEVVAADRVSITPGGKARLIQSDYRVPAAD